MRSELHERRRARILAAAREVFAEKGYSRAKVEDVAKAARVATATVYTHFDTKLGLFSAFVDGALHPYEGLFDRVEHAPGDAADRIGAYVRVYFSFMADPDVRAVYRIVSAETPHHPEMAMKLYEGAHLLLGGVLKRLLARFCDSGELTIPSIPIAARLLEGMIEHATLTISMLQGDHAEPLHPMEPYCEEAVRVFLAGYRSAG